MKQIKVCVATNRIGSTVTRVFDMNDDATEEEIGEIAWEVACDMIEFSWSEEECNESDI